MQTFITQDGSSIEYQLLGEGKPLILMHGFTEKGSVWHNIAEKLQQHFSVLIPFLPTKNQNGFAANFQDSPSIDGLATYINELATSIFGNKPFHFVGHSMGGYIGLSIANMHPEKLKTFTLFHSTAYADSDEKKIARQKSIDFILQHGSIPFLKQSIPGLFAEAFKTNHADKLQALINEQLDQSPNNLTFYLRAMKAREDHSAILKTLPIPFLFIAGPHDMAVPLLHVLEQQAMPKNASLIILEHSAHMGMHEEADIAYDHLEDFLLRSNL